MHWRLTALVVIALAGCGGNQRSSDGATTVQREELLRAFAAANEPLVVRLDLSEVDSMAGLEAIFVPEQEDVPQPPFELNLFETVEAADAQASSLDMVARREVDFVQRKNVILILAPSLPEERRGRLIDTLESLYEGP